MKKAELAKIEEIYENTLFDILQERCGINGSRGYRKNKKCVSRYDP